MRGQEKEVNAVILCLFVHDSYFIPIISKLLSDLREIS